MLRPSGVRNRVPTLADTATLALSTTVTSGTTTPTVTASSGTFTTVACTVTYERITGSNFVFATVTITITTNGSAAGIINVPMPFTAASEVVFAGRAAAVSAKQCQGIMLATSSTLVVANYDNTYPGANGERITLTGLIKV